MQLTRLIGLAPIIGMVLSASWRAASQEDPFIALETNAKCVHTYVRRDDIDAITDVSPSHCILVVTSRAGWFEPESEGDCRIGKVLIQSAGWSGGQPEWDDHIGAIFASGLLRRF